MREWERYRRNKMDGFVKALEKGEIDEDIVELLNLINSLEGYVTLSSCSGRIAVIDLPETGDKKSSIFLGKWHREVNGEEVIRAALESKSFAWLIQYPPILHVACRTLHHAEELVKIANNAGFRRSGVISLKNCVVEISSLERVELPLAVSGKLIAPEDYVNIAVKFANAKLRRGKDKLERLKEELRTFSG